MLRVNEEKLETDIGYRFYYMSDFVDMTARDVEAIRQSSVLLIPMLPTIVSVIYTKLFQYDCTKRHFLMASHGYRGEVPYDMAELTLDHPIMLYRRKHLEEYFEAVLLSEWDSNLVVYMDIIGAMHTKMAGKKEIDIPLIHMNAMMGFLHVAITDIIMSMSISEVDKHDMVIAYSKFLAIQQDFIVRHYECAPEKENNGEED
jgi:hypothetical protein